MGETFYTMFFALFLYNTFEFSLTQDFFAMSFILLARKETILVRKNTEKCLPVSHRVINHQTSLACFITFQLIEV